MDRSLKPQPEPVVPPEPAVATTEVNLPTGFSGVTEGAAAGPRTLRHIQVSGRVPLDQYTQLFSSFIMPLTQNNIEIEIRIKGKTTSGKPITDNSPEYKEVNVQTEMLEICNIILTFTSKSLPGANNALPVVVNLV